MKITIVKKDLSKPCVTKQKIETKKTKHGNKKTKVKTVKEHQSVVKKVLDVDFKLHNYDEKSIRKAKIYKIEGRKELPHEYWMRKLKTLLEHRDEKELYKDSLDNTDWKYQFQLQKTDAQIDAIDKKLNSYYSEYKKSLVKIDPPCKRDHEVLGTESNGSVLSIKTYRNKKE